jgi:predicted RecB family nuclease
LIEAPAFDVERALAETRSALDSGAEALFEAAFRWGPRETRVDVMALGADGWQLVEVKSSSRVKDEHMEDAAFQAVVVQEAGLPLAKVSVAVVNASAVRGESPLRADELFKIEDLTEPVRAVSAAVRHHIDDIEGAVAQTSPPEIPPGPHCQVPRKCPFYDLCNTEPSLDALENLPGVLKKKLKEWVEGGATSMLDVERFVKPGTAQSRAISAVRFSRTEVDDDLASVLAQVVFPACFIDFEAVSPNPPIYPGTRPSEAVPFQWSCHRLAGGEAEAVHSEFLATGQGDPRPEFVRTLLEAIEGNGSIVHYSNYEVTQLKNLAKAGIPGSTEALVQFERRGIDLLPIVKHHVYHPEFRGSFSIKKVLPALVPGLDYSDLDVQDGDTAAVRFLEMTAPGTTEARREKIARELLAYCERDTLAMVVLFRALLQLVDPA